ncbi:GNAT family N-acetyltransferase [Pedobacter changchengzhani]|uniref:GNAT family N-acetyltransferase n=1 Tax=Pedobacter changchengzhani TaxID=2529274 RepID=A0A4R5MJ25_9SPHI|nr:GNAT family N-acetyltransferase [Pedobacter changchengzhani]TDG35614.1 GNAT family N-acetyltransferase [Pedobacter changchengzhani]
MSVTLQKANIFQALEIWEILQQAILRRKADGSKQWQDGYPNLAVIKNDIEKNQGFVLMDDENIVGYCAILINNEPEYANLKGEWLSNEDFVVFHRVAIDEGHLGKGLAKTMMTLIEDFALENNIHSIKADTNFDNVAMLSIFEKLGYAYCGEVFFRGNARKAFEKVLN